MRYYPNRRFSAIQRDGALAFHIPKIDFRDDELFFLLTSCSHLPAYEPALSKESIESNHVNTPLKSSLRSHSCTYFLGLYLQKTRYKFSQNRPKTAMDQHFNPVFGRLSRRVESSEWIMSDQLSG